MTLASIFVGAGCSAGPGRKTGEATLLITRDFGALEVKRAVRSPIHPHETALRILTRNAQVKTSYGGRFVSAIDGVAGSTGSDWFYYVNGDEADVGAADREIDAGDVVWWDYHPWGVTMHIPAVVGSFPQPFINGPDGTRLPTEIVCGTTAEAACDKVKGVLTRSGVHPSTGSFTASHSRARVRVLVGPWNEVRRDSSARSIESGPARSGVFAVFSTDDGGYALRPLDPSGDPAGSATSDTGLIAATRSSQGNVTWVVTGGNLAAADRAASGFSPAHLKNRFAVLVEPANRFASLPVQP